MATLKLLVFLASCLVAYAIPQSPPKSKSTIFGDERLQGAIFENVDAFSNEVALADRNVDPNAYRLPNTTRPENYRVLWVVDTTNLVFEGTVDITFVANQANVREIVIHSHDLNITSLVMRLNNAILPTTYSFESEYHFLRIRLTSNELQYNPTNPVSYTLSVAFRAPLRNDMYGIYRSWFRNRSTDPIRWMATTQFQATAARFAFPCYDEPSFKATFDITIRRPVTHRSWSCTRIRQTGNSANELYQDDIYYQTPVMSTYLLALIVAEYHSLSVLENGNLTYEVIARQGAIEANQGQYAFDVGQELLAEMNNHTALNFRSMNPYLKMTQASIPDFSAGAMENWGLLTYREAYLMYDPAHTNDYYKQLIAYILSHEIAHMWFGNLVTCDWWGVLWLNEGFARYYQYFLTDWVEDYMGLGTRFITEQVHTALLADSADNPHPLTTPGIGSAAAVRTMFSTISYNKGAAVIRMTEHFLGFDVHREGLRNYLVERAYTTAQPIHLFRNLESVGISSGSLAAYGSDFNFIEYYKSWTEQSGHPVLHVNVNHQTGDMTITQRRFNINTGYSSVNTNWIIPITFATARNRNFNDTKATHIIRKSVTVINRNSTGDEYSMIGSWDAGVTCALAQLHTELGDAQTAKHHYQDVEAVWPCEVSALQWLAGDADPDEALRFYRRAARLQPSNPQWGLLMGGCLRASGRYQEALAIYKKLNARFPDNVQCLKLIVKLCGDQGLSETSAWTRELQRAQARLKQQERVLATSAGSVSSGASQPPSDLVRGGSRAERTAVSQHSSDGRGDSATVHLQQYISDNQEGAQAISRSVNRSVSRRKTEEFEDDLPLPPE